MDHSALSADLAKETDADLLVYMTMRDEDPLVARKAWDEFHRRHVEYIYKQCWKFHAVLGGEPGVCDLVQETLVRVYNKAHTFSARGLTDPGAIQVRVLAWVGKIATNLVRSMLRSDEKLPVRPLDEEEVAEETLPEPGGDGVAASGSELTLYQRALTGLSSKEREVLRVTAMYWRPGEKNQKLPNGVAEELAKQLRTTPENIRQIRRRALAQIHEFIQRETSES